MSEYGGNELVYIVGQVVSMVVWKRMSPVSLYICMLSPQLIDCLE